MAPLDFYMAQHYFDISQLEFYLALLDIDMTPLWYGLTKFDKTPLNFHMALITEFWHGPIWFL